MTTKKIATETEKARAGDGGCKSFAARPVQDKAEEALQLCFNIKASRGDEEEEAVYPEVSGTNPKVVAAVKKNDKDTLELFDIAKKSADVANAKGLLAAKAETSICVDTLSLLICFPISATAPETRRIMDRLGHLTRHKDRKICNSASALFQHWSQIIRDQQH
ncbi:transcription elongation factor TFIIS-like [Raphanus sativus]|uniref:Transcription elongation factor TFIIS-like n=1 Tax=Raphanus sativus TaxID=3726 RepID=A0A6J0MNS6_RAPSA|nr:transcription elongation factor TFIIS-like [Raphanus sativus]